MKLQKWIFLTLVLTFGLHAMAQDVVTATTEDLKEFDQMLAKKKGPDGKEAPAGKDKAKEDLRQKFNSSKPNANGSDPKAHGGARPLEPGAPVGNPGPGPGGAPPPPPPGGPPPPPPQH